jgi:transcription termination factor Rho
MKDKEQLETTDTPDLSGDGKQSQSSSGDNGSDEASTGTEAKTERNDSSSRSENDRPYSSDRRHSRSSRSDHKRDSSRNQSKRHRSFPKKQIKKKKSRRVGWDENENSAVKVGSLAEYELFNDLSALETLAADSGSGGDPVYINEYLAMPLLQLAEEARDAGVNTESAPNRALLFNEILKVNFERKVPLHARGCFEITDEGYGLIVFQHENYQIKPHDVFVPTTLINRYGLLRGHIVEAQVHPHREGETCPYALRILKIMDRDPDENSKVTPFEDLIPYYPLERFFLETNSGVSWDNISMRVVDLLTPIGFGQRGLIVAPPRTGKTVLLQGIANSIAENNPDVHLIVLLIDERPEEVTDFQRQVKGEVISSTFDETAWSHVHKHVVILLDSITRLARAYNTLMPSSGKILSGGVEASALQKPKRFFGSARNIEGGGSITIIATALVDTGSRMDEVIFEEFKGTGNMELHLDRNLVDKRVFPSLSMERSGTRKEELLYHPDELEKIYSMRRAMKGVPGDEAVEMLIQRVRKTNSNAEFLMSMNR